MNGFENIRFHGTFRDYQQRVLDNADTYLKDGKINIVAAPGSGKTVLGLELIRRLGEACVILSPTTAIRQQWGERFKELFLDDKTEFESLFSNDLHEVRLVNSITYQALYSAIEKIPFADEEEIDHSDIDLIQTLKTHNVKTICLDEAHHLKNEWQKALEKFLSLLDKDVKIVSLTATPPYDSEGSEWGRYETICGEIDEEIFVPELVGQNTLCPHQDYIYFNYPTQTELRAFHEHGQNAISAVENVGELAFMRSLCEALNAERDYEKLFENARAYIALLVLFRHFQWEVSKKLVKALTAKRGLPAFKMHYAETAIGFLLNGDLLSEEQKDELVSVLKKYSVYDKRKVSLVLNEKLKRSLVTSVGKLESIKAIARSEYANMGGSLRMLILTDYIKKENVVKIATEENFSSVNVVSIFETLRRENERLNIGILSGSLVILPNSVELTSVKHKKQAIDGTRYSVVEIAGSNHTAVDVVGKLFERGEIQILIGTKSLLGEGWDSPCINSLILASFVGSFVLSNQMRGRAIRIDKNDPDKTANIWHLVTVEPEYVFKNKVTERVKEYIDQDHGMLLSYDFEVLKRRFDAFMGPNYTTGKIESGIERLTAIQPPYDQKGIERINEEMLSRSALRGEIKEQWKNETAGTKFQTVVEESVPEEKRVPIFTFYNFALWILLLVVEAVALQGFLQGLSVIGYPLGFLFVAVEGVIFYGFYRVFKHILAHSNPARSMKTLGCAVYETLKACELISGSAKVEAKQDKHLSYVNIYLRNASIHDQNVFNTAMTELLSPIENPRYILIKKNIFKQYDYTYSFACPSIIGKRKEYALVLAEKLKGNTGNFELLYTHKEDGRKIILKCRKKSYVTYNQKIMNRKYKVSHWE